MLVEQRSFYKRKTRTDNSKSSFVLRHVTSTQLSPSDETLQMTETMKAACEGKTIFYNHEHLVVDEADYTNDTIKDLGARDAQRFKSLEKNRQKREASRQFGCQNVQYKFSNEATRNCGTWTYTGIQDTVDNNGATRPPSWQIFNHVHSAWQLVIECCADEGTLMFPCSAIPNGPSDDGEQAFSTAFFLSWENRIGTCPGKSKYCQWDATSTKYSDLYPGAKGACTSECQTKCTNGRCPKCYGWVPGFYNC